MPNFNFDVCSLITMAIRKFLKPSSLDSKLAPPVNYTPYTNDTTPDPQQEKHTTSPPTAVAAVTPATTETTAATAATAMAKTEETKTVGVTYSFQEDLPSLPIPELEETCKRYLDSLRPLQSAKEFADSQVAVKEFLKYDGPKLQKSLKEYAEGKANYIEQFCK